MECPLCSNKYSLADIEEHVERCLSGESPGTSQPKRTIPFDDDDPPPKKQKMNFLGESSRISTTEFSKIHNGSQGGKNKSTTLSRSQGNNDFRSNVVTDARRKMDHVPLAEQLRPTSLGSYVGQKHLLGPATVLGRLLENRDIPSMILWGPPGCGKVKKNYQMF